jgi:hypothetical protein
VDCSTAGLFEAELLARVLAVVTGRADFGSPVDRVRTYLSGAGRAERPDAVVATDRLRTDTGDRLLTGVALVLPELRTGEDLTDRTAAGDRRLDAARARDPRDLIAMLLPVRAASAGTTASTSKVSAGSNRFIASSSRP